MRQAATNRCRACQKQRLPTKYGTKRSRFSPLTGDEKEADFFGLFLLDCGAEGDRTPGLRIANASLSQLSYSPTLLFILVFHKPQPDVRQRACPWFLTLHICFFRALRPQCGNAALGCRAGFFYHKGPTGSHGRRKALQNPPCFLRGIE